MSKTSYYKVYAKYVFDKVCAYATYVIQLRYGNQDRVSCNLKTLYAIWHMYMAPPPMFHYNYFET
jgi:hypothetical protein